MLFDVQYYISFDNILYLLVHAILKMTPFLAISEYLNINH